MVNIDDMSKESLKKFFERKFGKDLKIEEKKEDYTVDGSEEIVVDEDKNLVFGKDAEVRSLWNGDGVFVGKKFVKAVTIDLVDNFNIYLKGTTRNYSDEKVLYECDE